MAYIGKDLQSNNVHEDCYYYHHHHHSDDSEVSGLFQFYTFQACAATRMAGVNVEKRRSGCVLACLVRIKLEWCSGLRGSSGEILQKFMNIFSVK